jgi:hypothetical protein
MRFLSSVGTIHIIADGFNRRKADKNVYKFRRNDKYSLMVRRSDGTRRYFSYFPTVETVGYDVNRSYGTQNPANIWADYFLLRL